MKFVNREAAAHEVRFWTVAVALAWGCLFVLLALYLAGVL